jgi:hypothetical protein
MQMVSATILHVGDDHCHRVPVMERNGLAVLCTECSVGGVRTSLAKSGIFSAVTFHNDLLPPAEAVVSTARELCRVPLILFMNPAVECDDGAFDVVIPVPSSPDVWAKSLREAIQQARELRDLSRQLRQDCAVLRDASRNLREASMRNRSSTLVDYNALFRGEASGASKKSDDEGDGS